MIVTLPTIIGLLAAFLAGRRSAEKTPAAAPTRRAPLAQPQRPRTLAAALAQHPRLDYGVRRRLVGDPAETDVQELQLAAALLLEERLAKRSLHTCDVQEEPGTKILRLGPLGATSALAAIRQAQEMGAHVFVTLAGAFELVAGVPTGPVALVAFTRPDRPALANRQFARIPRLGPAPQPAAAATSEPIASPPPPPPQSAGANGVHKPSVANTSSPPPFTGVPGGA